MGTRCLSASYNPSYEQMFVGLGFLYSRPSCFADKQVLNLSTLAFSVREERGSRDRGKEAILMKCLQEELISFD